jgi:hypothetical protein
MLIREVNPPHPASACRGPEFVAAIPLNERDRGGRLICPVCTRPIRAWQRSTHDGIYRRHAECGSGIIQPRWEGRMVRALVRAVDWEDLAWRAQFETDLKKTGWRLIAIEPPSADTPEYMYILAPEEAPPASE